MKKRPLSRDKRACRTCREDEKERDAERITCSLFFVPEFRERHAGRIGIECVLQQASKESPSLLVGRCVTNITSRGNAFAVVIRRFNYGGHYRALMDTRQSTSNVEAFIISNFSPCRSSACRYDRGP